MMLLMIHGNWQAGDQTAAVAGLKGASARPAVAARLMAAEMMLLMTQGNRKAANSRAAAVPR